MPASHGAPERTGRASRAWRAGCDVNPGGGGVGPSAPVPGLARAPVMAKTVNTLFPAAKSSSKACRSPRSHSPISRPTAGGRAAAGSQGRRCPKDGRMDVLSLGELSCSACCRLEHISTSLPIARTHVRRRNSSTAKPAPGQVASESSGLRSR